MEVTIKRVYEKSAPEDGYRVLVDRLWPRGIRKAELKIDEWCKEVAPSTELRKWFGHDPERFEEFAKRYILELDQAEECQQLLKRAKKKSGRITLLYAAKNPEVNHAVVLRGYLESL